MDSNLAARMKTYRQAIFWILAFGYALVYFHRLCPAVVALDMMKDLSAGGTLLGVLGSAYFYPYALMQLPAGLLSDSWGPRRTITLFFSVAFFGSLVLGLAPNATIAIVGRVMVGLGVSMLFVPTMKILAEWFEVRHFSTMTGILMAMGGLGSLTAASPLAALSSWLGWRGSFVIVGVITLALGITVWFVVRDRPSDMGFPPPDDALKSSAPPVGLLAGMKTVAATLHFWPLALWFFFDCAVFFSFAGLWGGPYMMQIHGLSKAQAGSILSLSAIGMIVGSPLLSHLSTRILKGRKPVLVLSAFITFLLTLVLYLAVDTIPVWGLYLFCLLMGIFTSAIVAIGFTSAKELFPVAMAGTSTGMANLFPFAGGAVFQPVLGAVLEAAGKNGQAFTLAGYRQAFLVLALCGFLCFACSLKIRETYRG